MTNLLSRCTQEMYEQRQVFREASKESVPDEIQKRFEGLIELEKDFKNLAKEKPWALQKISLEGIILVKVCIQKVKNQCQILFQRIWKERFAQQKE